MNRRSFILTILCISMYLLGILQIGCTAPESKVVPIESNAPDPTFLPGSKILTISYIDVGQGDSILIQTPNGKTMLIDAGDVIAADTVATFLKDRGVQTVDVLVLTHPKQSHVGGMPNIIDRFQVGSFYMPECDMTNAMQSMKDLSAAVKSKGLKVITATAGLSIPLDDSLKVSMIAPIGNHYETTNDYSAVIKITYNQTTFLFPGDATEVSETEMLKAGADLKADVLKVGHHADAASSSAAFLKAVSPKIAVISVGKEYLDSLPAQDVLDRLGAVNAAVYRTDKEGTIVVTSDGRAIHVRCMGL